MELKSGARLRSQVDATEVVVVRAGSGGADIACGGHPMVDTTATPLDGLAVADGLDGGTLLGKRYTDAAGEMEVLVTKPGQGSLTLGGTPLELKSAKPLPASD
jgi:hypothetical protein